MTSSIEFLTHLREQGIQLFVEGDRLRYRAPAGALTPALRAELQQRKAELHDLLQAAAPAPATIAADPHATRAPLTFGQQRLWLLHQVHSSSAYHVPVALRLTGDLDDTRLHHSLHYLLARHASLRTSFAEESGTPVQRVQPTVSLPLPRTDLRGAHDPEAALHALAQACVALPFDLTLAPLLRAELVQLAEQSHMLLLVLHHIISDGMSVDILVRELATTYTALATPDATPDLPALPVSYLDYARWEQQQDTATNAAGLRYWQQQLAAMPALLPLPLDYPRPAVASMRGAQYPQQINRPLLDGLRALSTQAGVTLPMTMLATYALLLLRYTGQADVPIGVPVNHRPQPELAHLTGFFLNTLVLRVQVSPDLTGLQLLQQVRDVALAAYAHQDVPFDAVVEALQPERSTSYTPLFQAMFEFENDPLRDLTTPRLRIEREWLTTSGAQTDLALLIEETPQQLICQWEYATDLFAPATIARLAASYHTLLTALVQQPDLPVAQLPVLAPDVQQLVLRGWNDTARPLPPATCVHHLIEQQAQRTPDAVAIQMGDTRLTYAELDQQATLLAAHMCCTTRTPDTPVGLLVPRSPALVVAMLAILKAGAAYVPLDPTHPTERMRLILADAQPALLLTERSLLPLVDALATPLLLLDDLPPLPADLPTPPPLTPQHLAYIIYTSGSTGKPKGVEVTHSAVVNFLLSMQREPGISAADRLLAVTTVAFDIALLELFLPLTVGAQVLLATPAQAHDGLLLADLLTTSGATLMQATPATWRMLLAAGWQGTPDLRMLCGGEALLPDLAAQLLQRGRALWNVYGPTETTIWSTIGRVLAADAPISVGRPLANTRCYILDSEGMPVPPGVIGELCIGGAGVARGYHNQPDLTATKFVPDPFAADPVARIYRTGDRARFLPDGRIEYLGRSDFQIKLRGIRIEPAEIEAVLLELPAVREAVVLLLQDEQHDPLLAAYVVPAPAANADDTLIEHLREHARRNLPAAMVPASYVLLERLPLTPNGKLDRTKLPVPTLATALPEVPTPPRTLLEQVLCEIWQAVLGVEQFGVHDNFFLLGGHSLRATQVVARLRDALGQSVPVRWLFEQPTIAGFAAIIAAETGAEPVVRPASAAPEAAPDQRDHNAQTIPRRRPTDRPLLSLAQQRLWFLEQISPDAPTYNLALAFWLAGDLDVLALEMSIFALIHRHSSLRTAFIEVQGEPLQQIAAGLSISLPRTSLLHLPPAARPAAVQALLNQRARTPLSMVRSDLVRIELIQHDPQAWVLLLVIHHSISDGWSLDLMIHELGVLYAAHIQRTVPALPDLHIEYADYALWQRARLASAAMQQQRDYWLRQLGDAPPLLELPTARPRPSVQPTTGERLQWQLPADLLPALHALARQHDATLYMTVLAAFGVLLLRYTASTDLTIGTPLAGRSHTALEPLVGFFVQTLVLRVQPDPAQSFAHLLDQVRHTCLDALAHADFPFEQLVEALHPERSLSHQPLFQVAFALEQAPHRTLQLPGVRTTTEWLHTGAVQYDLALLLEETDGQVRGEWAYATALFDAATIQRMAANFEVLLRALVAQPTAPVGHLPLLSVAERQQLLVDWNATALPYDRHTPAHALVAARAASQPHALAVTDGHRSLTYAALDAEATRLAGALRMQGVQPADCVVLCLERSTGFVVALLAVLKAGAAFLPLEPDTPPARLHQIIGDAQPRLLLTCADVQPRLPAVLTNCRTIEGLLAHNHNNGASPALPAVDAEQRACIIYTSGSTGMPKGVQLKHGGLANLIAWYCHYYAVTPQDRLTQLVGLNFDAVVWELLPALAAGASIHIPDADTRITPLLLRDWLTAQAITITFVPTPLAEQLLLLDWSSTATLRVMQTAGDVLRGYPPAGLPFVLYNNYGPSETTIVATATPVAPADATTAATSLPPIGRPVGNTQVYVLDALQQPVPIGVPGELYIGGDGLAAGYLGRPDLTAAAFVAHPLARAGERLYRSGDRVRYRADGQLEFLGRMDEQVKIRGVRVEPGEVAATLQQHPRVQQALVLAATDNDGSRYLIAYVVPHCRDLGTAELGDYLAARLPAAMLPAAWVLLDALPLTANGKIDRRALPAPTLPRSLATVVAPRTPLEQQIAPIWAEVLGLPTIGVFDDFFAAGGHSLRAMQLVSRLTQATGLPLSVRDLFTAPTVAALAELLAARTPQAVAAEPAARPAAQPPPPAGLTIETRPLLTLHAAGMLAPVDAAALYYLPADVVAGSDLGSDALLDLWTAGLPLLDDIVATSAGRIASILLPRTSTDLYTDPAGLIEQIIQGLQLARTIGARVVSLTGLLPSATDYGQAVQARLNGNGQQALPPITTGHATTTAAVILNVQRILTESGRNLADERVGVLGLGSIGQASLRLLLDLLPHPRELLLCDVYARRAEVQQFADLLVHTHGYTGTVRVLAADTAAPDEFYAASLMIGATSVPDVLDIWRVMPGTLIVDDSGPHCYNQREAENRFSAQHDILFTEGGALEPPRPIQSVRYIPAAVSQHLTQPAAASLRAHAPDLLMGCTLSAALSAQEPALVPTVGLVDLATSRQHVQYLQAHGYRGAPLHSGTWRFEQWQLAAFRRHFAATGMHQQDIMR